MVFGQQVSERLIGKFLHALAAVAGEQIERLPSLSVKVMGLLATFVQTFLNVSPSDSILTERVFTQRQWVS
jgi:hypothetical protein